MLVFVASVAWGLKAQSISGNVVDRGTGEPVVGATVSLSNGQSVSTGLNGGFSFHKLAEGSYEVKITYQHYQAIQIPVSVTKDQPVSLQLSLANAAQNLDEVVVNGAQQASSEQVARLRELSASQVINTLSGRAIQLSPDLTVANAVQRISGVSLERNSNGDGQHAILRGMDKRYNYTLVNGVKISSPDNRYRYVPLDIFPSELLDRLEVYKSLTADMEGDAIGGAINMLMKDAPAAKTFAANLATGYSQLFLDRDFKSYQHQSVSRQSPFERYGADYTATAADFNAVPLHYSERRPLPNVIGGLTLGNRFMDNRLGVLVAGSFQNTYRGSNSILFNERREGDESRSTLTALNERQFSEQQTRLGLHAKVDFRLNDSHRFRFYNAYMNFKNAQVRDIAAINLQYGGYNPTEGHADMSFSTRARVTRQAIYNSTLQGDHRLSTRLSTDWSLVYSHASSEQPDNTTVSTVGQMTNFERTETYAAGGRRRWEHNRDRDLNALVNFTYASVLWEAPLKIKVGGLYRDKQRSNFFNEHIMRTPIPQPVFGQDYERYDEINWTFGGPSYASPLTYDAFEQIGAGYTQFDWKSEKVDVIAGVRAEHTSQGFHMLYVTTLPDGEQRYFDILPSVNFKYKIKHNNNLRASYYRSLNRPGFFEIVPYTILNEDYTERGNPDLKRAIADNFDLRYELLSSTTNLVMVGVFYKHIKDPIEYTLQADAIRGQDIYYAPGNFGDAQNLGLEIDFSRYFNKIGLRANYTYTHSAITTDKSKRIRDENGDFVLINVAQTRPLFGQSAHIGNLSALYKDTKTGFDAQLTANYTGERIFTVAQFVDADYWQKGFLQLDASLEKRLKRRTFVFLKAQNLLNTPMEVFQKSAPTNGGLPYQDLSGETLIQRDSYQRSLLIGLRVDF
ncbi:TonB-dependent receptor [Sphingobacterium oryzagri]|uniref:TonB-dependent receptor n=1 Tax=Sphingobacterium oryzagri TaxID=3025669 RepID=A0ABY7WG11_9SPHI|nr:TonB-dependent receptor [Sphingobacterium sp. KACC 22765]WDF67318.1 TonB-dependent receptor [Sphingobacterium sp. KACC 22765]